jgi:hypothetical protein
VTPCCWIGHIRERRRPHGNWPGIWPSTDHGYQKPSPTPLRATGMRWRAPGSQQVPGGIGSSICVYWPWQPRWLGRRQSVTLRSSPGGPSDPRKLLRAGWHKERSICMLRGSAISRRLGDEMVLKAASVGKIARRRTEQERAEALFPPRVTTTAADSKARLREPPSPKKVLKAASVGNRALAALSRSERRRSFLRE